MLRLERGSSDTVNEYPPPPRARACATYTRQATRTGIFVGVGAGVGVSYVLLKHGRALLQLFLGGNAAGEGL